MRPPPMAGGHLGEFVGVDVDADNSTGAGLLAAHNGGKPDASKAEYGHRGAGLHLHRVQRSAVARGDAAAEQADLGQSRAG